MKYNWKRFVFPKRTSFVINKLMLDLTIPIKVIEQATKTYLKEIKRINNGNGHMENKKN